MSKNKDTNKKDVFNEKEYWENRTEAYLKETKSIPLWKKMIKDLKKNNGDKNEWTKTCEKFYVSSNEGYIY